MSSEQRIGDWCQTFTGRQFWPLDPWAEDIVIEDIAHALSNQCRFGGHCRQFYSVAQHSVEVSLELDEDLALAFCGLLHDAPEAYLMDVPRPIKRWLINYQVIEHDLQVVIARRFGLAWPMPPEVKHADEVLLATEARDLMAPPVKEWAPMPPPRDRRIGPMGPESAETMFLCRYSNLVIRRGRAGSSAEGRPAGGGVR